MHARIYGKRFEESETWAYLGAHSFVTGTHPTEALLNDWLESQAGRDAVKEVAGDQFLVVPDNTDYLAAQYQASWKEVGPPTRVPVLTRVGPFR